MNYSVKIDSKYNEMFYREASRAKSIDEINGSAGMKLLASREIELAKRALAEEYIKSADVIIQKDSLGYYAVAIGK